MTTMNISIPDALKSFVDDQVGESGYSTASEYIRELIRKDRDLQRFRALLLDGNTSPKAAIADVDYFDRCRSRIREAGQP